MIRHKISHIEEIFCQTLELRSTDLIRIAWARNVQGRLSSILSNIRRPRGVESHLYYEPSIQHPDGCHPRRRRLHPHASPRIRKRKRLRARQSHECLSIRRQFKESRWNKLGALHTHTHTYTHIHTYMHTGRWQKKEDKPAFSRTLVNPPWTCRHNRRRLYD